MIILHADDYGISANASKDILSLIEKEKIYSFSIIPNMSCFSECMKMLTPVLETRGKSLSIALHINLFEGHCCAEPSQIPLLVDSNGFFQPDWKWFFYHSYLPGRRELRKQLSIEIHAQIKRFLAVMPADYVLNLDSHQHSHMIPVVWDAIGDVVTRNNYRVNYVRISREPLTPYLRCPYLLQTFPRVNFIKNIIIQFCSIHAKWNPIVSFKGKYYLWGLVMGGAMDYMRLRKLLPYFEKYGQEPNTLEVLFHPGLMLQSELTEEYNKIEFVNDEISARRETEYRTLMRI